MNATKQLRLQLDISNANGVWEVVIFDGSHSEHRSFLPEDEAKRYGAARIEQLRLGKPKSQSDGAVT